MEFFDAQARAILAAAHEARHRARLMEQEVPAYVITWYQRDLLSQMVKDADEDTPRFRRPPPQAQEYGQDPDMLFGAPVIIATTSWQCPNTGLVDLRGV